MKKNALVLGVGLMGQAVVFAFNKLGYNVICCDSSVGNLNKVSELSTFSYHIKDNIDKFNDQLSYIIKINKFDIAVSCLPYELNKLAASICVDKRIRYCDLGGFIGASTYIYSLARTRAQKPIMSDLGLAPGLVNILAEYLVSLHGKVHTVRMFCGGLPQEKTDDYGLNYSIVFSPEGLVNEYFNKCYKLFEGEIIGIPSMGKGEDVFIDCEDYESFYTSGAAHTTLSSMKRKGVGNCSYKTIRYPGHRGIILFLKNCLGKTNEELVKLIDEICPKDKKDKVLIQVQILGENSSVYDYKILPQDGYTAMQRGTAYPAVAVADLMAQGLLDKHKYVTYADIPFDLVCYVCRHPI
jgi:saccharopine dehydrogenase-like NADP-dependent oxidoreductase